jgi:plastocyanin
MCRAVTLWRWSIRRLLKQGENPEQADQFSLILKKERTMMRKTACILGLLIVVMAATLLMSAGSSSSSAKTPQPAAAEVKIDNFSFGPTTLTVAVGATVTWTNRDDIPHTVVSTEKLFKSKVLDTDEKFSYTFTKAGTYPYFCSIHPKMTGSVVVQ